MRTTVILKTDIVDSTPRTAQLTQSEMGLQRRQHKQFISGIAAKSAGMIFQEEGDAYWITMPSVTTAVLAAIEMHQALRAMQAGKGDRQRLSIRAVIAVGDILFQENDTIGTTMSLTARIEKVTPPDEIYLSQAAWSVMNKAEIQTSLVGEFVFKGFPEPEKVYKVDQKYRTRVLTGQYIVFTDAKGFTQFIQSSDIEQVERFLLDCDDLMNGICEKYHGTIRQVNGDQYFITFSECESALEAVQELGISWRHMAESYHVGLALGVHQGSLNVVRSYVYGEDIHVAVFLSELQRLYHTETSDVWIVISATVEEELKGSKWESKLQKMDDRAITQERYKLLSRQGVYRLLLEE